VSAALDLARQIVPPSAVDTVRGPVERVVDERGVAQSLLSLGVIIAVWSANQIYAVQTRRFFHRLPRQLLLALGLLVLLSIIMVAMVVTGPAAQTIGNAFDLSGPVVLAYRIARWPALFFAAMVMFSLLYHFAPNVRQPGFRWITAGGVFGVLLWLTASVAFDVFVRYIADYGATYEALAGVVVFLLGLLILNLAQLTGAELNEQVEDERERRGKTTAVSARRARATTREDEAA
jgi:membrane protein